MHPGLTQSPPKLTQGSPSLDPGLTQNLTQGPPSPHPGLTQGLTQQLQVQTQGGPRATTQAPSRGRLTRVCGREGRRTRRPASPPLRVVVYAEQGGAGRIHVLTNESDVNFLAEPCMYAGDVASHVANRDGLHYSVAGLVKGAKAFVVGRRWEEYIFCVPLVCATREEAVAQAALLPGAI